MSTARIGRTRGRTRWLWLVAVLLVQGGLVAAAVAPQLSARALGQEYRLRVEPVDPIDPFRGAYVALAYPDLRPPAAHTAGWTGLSGVGGDTVFVPLVADGDTWRGGTASPQRPSDGPYLSCRDEGWRYRCGIESWFVPQDEARRWEDAVRGGGAVAVVRLDERGNAAIVEVQEG